MSRWTEFVRHLPVYQPGDPVDFVVCVPCGDGYPLLLLDNEIADCTRCGTRVQFRPDVPPGPKVCIECAMAKAQEQGL
jgi:hypothetical protein